MIHVNRAPSLASNRHAVSIMESSTTQHSFPSPHTREIKPPRILGIRCSERAASATAPKSRCQMPEVDSAGCLRPVIMDIGHWTLDPSARRLSRSVLNICASKLQGRTQGRRRRQHNHNNSAICTYDHRSCVLEERCLVATCGGNRGVGGSAFVGGRGDVGDAGTASHSLHGLTAQYCSRAVHRLLPSPDMVQAGMNGKNKGIHRGLTAA